MKKVLVLALGLGIILSTVSLAQDADKSTKKAKKTKKKTADGK